MAKATLTRRNFLQLSATTAVTAWLAACAAPAQPASTGTGEDTAGQPGQAPLEIRVSAWGDVPDKNINDRTAAALAEVHPHLRMVPETYVGGYYDKVQVNFAGGTAPDLVYMEGYRWQPFIDVAVPLDDYIQRDDVGAAWPEVENYDNLTQWRGNTYLSIVDTGSIVMFYNKTVFDMAEVPYPTDDWTFDDFRAMVPSLTNEIDGIQYYGSAVHGGGSLGGYVWWIPWLRMNGALEFDQIVEPTRSTWTEPEIVDALQFVICDSIEQGYSPSPSVIQGGGISIATNRVAMGLQGPWYLPQCKGPQAVTEGGVDFDVVLPPAGSAGTKPDAEIQGHMISAQSEHQDEAWEVLKFWLGEEVARITAEEGRMCGTPELTDKYWVPIATETYGFENASAFVQAQLNGQSPVINGAGANYTAFTGAGGPLTTARDAMMGLEKSAQEALEEANVQIQEMLDEYWAERESA